MVAWYLITTSSQLTTLPLLRLISSDTDDFDIRKEFSECLERNSLIISEGEEIRRESTNRSEYVSLIAENHIRLGKCYLYMFWSLTFRMDRISSLSRENSMISSDHDGHFFRIFLSLWEVMEVPRMEYIECTETHHMVKYLFWSWRSGYFSIDFGSMMLSKWKWHKFDYRQIGKRSGSWIQKVNNFEKSFDKM